MNILILNENLICWHRHISYNSPPLSWEIIDKDEHTRFQEALQLNQPPGHGLLIKDDLYRAWQQEDKERAAFLLDDWIKRAAVSGIQRLKQFANTLAAYRSGILAYYDFDRLSGGNKQQDQDTAENGLWISR